MPRKTFDFKTRKSKDDQENDPANFPASSKWQKHDTVFLADMQKVTILPNRVASTSVLVGLGLWDDVSTLLDNIGFGSFYLEEHETYPKLVREFLATCRVTYKDPCEPIASEGTFTFFINKKFYTLAINEVCDIFGFPHHEQIGFGKFDDASEFWNLIAKGTYVSRAAKITHIRNPVVRVAVKIISNTMFFKKEPSSVRDEELWMVFYGVKHLLDEFSAYPPNDVNLGAVLITELVKLKTQAPKSKKKELYIGTLLTHIFTYIGVDFSQYESVDIERVPSIDQKHMISCHILKGYNTYHFYTRSGREKLLTLPARDITSLISRENLIFEPPESVLIDVPNKGRPRHRPAAFQASSSHVNDDGDDVQPHILLPSDSSQYLLPDVPQPENVEEREQWKIDTLRKNNDMLHRIWAAISKIRPCACLSGPQVRRSRTERVPNDDPPGDHEEEGRTDDDVELPVGARAREVRSKMVHDGGEGPSRCSRRRRRRLGERTSESDSSA